MNPFITTQYDADARGYFGPYGGCYVPEMLVPVLDQLAQVYAKLRDDTVFQNDFLHLLKTYVGRPSPLMYAGNLTRKIGGAQIYLKNEGANLTGAHKINHCIGQALIAQRMHKKILIAETGAGQHGVATATVAAQFDMQCIVFMGAVDMQRQMPNVQIMRMLGAEVVSVESGSQTLKDAVDAAIKYFVAHADEAHYVLGSCLGPHPYPSMNRDFQTIVGLEIQQQIKAYGINKPHTVIACIGGGSNAMGAFNAFLDDIDVKLIGVEAGGKNIDIAGEHASRIAVATKPQVGIFHGYRSYFLQGDGGNINQTHSIAAGLDYPGIGPQLAYLYDQKRIQAESASDDEALDAMRLLARTEGIIPALESSHAIAYAIRYAPTLSKDMYIVVNVSGRGDKDLLRKDIIR